MRLTTKQILDAHKKLKAEQEKLTPYLTFGMMRKILGYQSNSPVQNILSYMVEMGLVVEIEFGDEKRYKF